MHGGKPNRIHPARPVRETPSTRRFARARGHCPVASLARDAQRVNSHITMTSTTRATSISVTRDRGIGFTTAPHPGAGPGAALGCRYRVHRPAPPRSRTPTPTRPASPPRPEQRIRARTATVQRRPTSSETHSYVQSSAPVSSCRQRWTRRGAGECRSTPVAEPAHAHRPGSVVRLSGSADGVIRDRRTPADGTCDGRASTLRVHVVYGNRFGAQEFRELMDVRWCRPRSSRAVNGQSIPTSSPSPFPLIPEQVTRSGAGCRTSHTATQHRRIRPRRRPAACTDNRLRPRPATRSKIRSATGREAVLRR